MSFGEMLDLVNVTLTSLERAVPLDPKKVDSKLILEIEDFKKLRSDIIKLMNENNNT